MEFVAEQLRAAGYNPESAERAEIPTTYTKLTTEDDCKYMDLLLSRLEEDDDVQEVFHNWEQE